MTAMALDSLSRTASPQPTEKTHEPAPPPPPPPPAPPAEPKKKAVDFERSTFEAPKAAKSVVLAAPAPAATPTASSTMGSTGGKVYSLSELMVAQKAAWSATSAKAALASDGSTNGSATVPLSAETAVTAASDPNAEAWERVQRDLKLIESGGKAAYRNGDYLVGLLKNNTDKEYRALFMGAMRDKPGAWEALGGTIYNADGTVNSQNLEAVAGSVSAAMKAATMTEDEVRDLATIKGTSGEAHRTAKNWTKIGMSTQPPVITGVQDPGASGAATRVSTATSKLQAAQDEVKKKNELLDTELARLGPALTANQREDYIRAFQEKYGPVYQAEKDATEALKQALADPAMATAYSDPDVAKAVYEGHQRLAQTPEAETSVRWSATVMGDPAQRAALEKGLKAANVAGAKDLAADMQKNILQPGFARAGAAMVARNGGDSDKAMEELAGLAEVVKNVNDLGEGLGDMKSVFDAYQAAKASGDFKQMRDILRQSGGMSPEMKGLTAAMVGLSGFLAVQKGQEGDYKGALKEALDGTKGVGDLYVSMLESFSGAPKALKNASDFAGKWMPVVGIMADTVSFAIHFEGAIQEKSPQLAAAAFGDVLAVTGGIMTLFPPTTVPGLLLSGVGTVISASGELAHTAKLNEDMKGEMRELLGKVKPDPDGGPLDVNGLIDAAGDNLYQLASGAGLSPLQVQEFVRRFPGATHYGDGAIGGLVEAGQAMQVYGRDFLEYMGRLETEAKQQGFELGYAGYYLSITGLSPGMTREQHLQKVFPESTAWVHERQRQARVGDR
jgi:hypothetical protein